MSIDPNVLYSSLQRICGKELQELSDPAKEQHALTKIAKKVFLEAKRDSSGKITVRFGKKTLGWRLVHLFRKIVGISTKKTTHLSQALESVRNYYGNPRDMSPINEQLTKVINKVIEKTGSGPTIQSVTQEVSKTDTAPQTPVQETNFKELYYNFVERSIPFLDGWFSNLKELRKGADSEMILYIQSEARSLRKMIEKEKKETAQFKVFQHDPSYKEAMSIIRGSFRALSQELEAFVNQLVPEHRLPKTSTTSPVAGIKNVGNSCYMNSALQGLFSSPLIIDRIKSYNKDPIPDHERFMPTLQEFLVAYEANQSKAIGECASQLRSELFHTRLENLDVEYINDMADADLIVMVLGETLGMQYPLLTRRTAEKGTTAGGDVVNEDFISDVTSYQLLWPECKTSGGENELSLQEYFNQDCLVALEEKNLGWRQQATDGQEVTVNEATVAYRIAGDPPPILAFKIGNSLGVGMDAPFIPYTVGKRDEIFDASLAFDEPPPNGAKYRLIGILENHSRIHWTAKCRRQDGWYDCNDNRITPLGRELPSAQAAVMIYELITD